MRAALDSRAGAAIRSLTVALVAVVLASPAEARKAHLPAGCGAPAHDLLSGAEERVPQELSGEPDPSVLSRFEVLRRPAGQLDQPPPINPLASELGFELGSYYPHRIRQLLETPDGERYFAVIGFRREFPVPPARCLPPGLRGGREGLVREAQEEAKELVYCIAELARQADTQRGGYEVGNCHPFADIESGAGLIASDMSRSRVVDIVPDGVATVRLVYRDGSVIDAPVGANTFSFTPPQAPIRRARAVIHRLFVHALVPLATGHLTPRQRRHMRRRLRALQKLIARTLGSLPPRQVQWLDANGGVLRSIAPHLPDSSGGRIVISG